MYVYILYTCLCYMLREKTSAGRGRGAGGGGGVEADGAEGRRLMQQRSATQRKRGKFVRVGERWGLWMKRLFLSV